jgi:hypothetical protein
VVFVNAFYPAKPGLMETAGTSRITFWSVRNTIDYRTDKASPTGSGLACKVDKKKTVKMGGREELRICSTI